MRPTRTILSISTLTLLLSACAYVIPPEQNAPRHNEVRGDLRRPQLNGAGPQAQARAVAPDAPVAVNTAALSPAPAEAAPAEANDAPMVAANPLGERRVPVENQPFQTAAMGYAPITDVPPRPATTGADSAPERLRATQSELERERSNAYESRDALSRDAAAEPVLSPMPAPALVQPTTSQPRHTPPMNQPDASATPMMPLPASAAFVPPAPLVAEQEIAVAPVLPPPPGLPSLAPITLNPPTPLAAAPRATGPATALRGPLRSDFDPLAAADNTPVANAAPQAIHAPVVVTPRYATSGYIPPSRYQERRF